MKKETFYIEVTDTFSGDANYSWIRRYAVRATSARGAMRVVGKHEGYALKFYGCRWDFIGACICAYIVEDCYDEANYRKLNF